MLNFMFRDITFTLFATDFHFSICFESPGIRKNGNQLLSNWGNVFKQIYRLYFVLDFGLNSDISLFIDDLKNCLALVLSYNKNNKT